MTASSCAAEIRNLIDTLSAADIVLDSNSVGIVGSGGRARVTWRGDSGLAPLWRQDSPSVAEYTMWLANRQFSVVLLDGGLLQLTFDFAGADIVGHRLAYVPCPFDFDRELLLEMPLLDLLQDFGPPPADDVRLRSPIRFDFDPTATRTDHPASHVTMISSTCRIPSAGPLSLGHFVRFVFRHFYPTLWGAHPFLRTWSQADGNRTLLQEEETELHMNWLSVVLGAA